MGELFWLFVGEDVEGVDDWFVKVWLKYELEVLSWVWLLLSTILFAQSELVLGINHVLAVGMLIKLEFWMPDDVEGMELF